MKGPTAPPAVAGSAEAPRVAAVRFFRYGCSEQSHPLFQRAYARSNRARGSKIMRCFPHCCPDHVPRRYCGCSLHVLVELDQELARDQALRLVVCARFEQLEAPSRGRASPDAAVQLELGSLVRLPAYLFEGEDRTEKPWILAEKETESRQREAPTNAVVYSLNKHKFPVWSYNYESGATKWQREMQHCLRVYVLQLRSGGPGEAENATNGAPSYPAAVLAHHASPPFSLLSYRRANTVEGRLRSAHHPDGVDRVSRESKAALEEADQDDQVPDDTESVVADSEMQSQASEYTSTPTESEHRQIEGQQFEHREAGSAESTPTATPAQIDVPAFRGRIVCRERKVKLQHLRILYMFLSAITVDWLESHIRNVTDIVRERWLSPVLLHVGPHPRVGQLLSDFSLSTLIARLSSSRHVRLGMHCPPLVTTCVDAALYVVNSGYILHILQVALASTIDNTDGRASGPSRSSEMFSVFENCIDRVYDTLTTFLVQGRTETLSRLTREGILGYLVDDIVSYVYQVDTLSVIRRPVMDVMREMNSEAQDAALYRAFLAQTAEMSIARDTRSQKGLLGNRSTSTDGVRDLLSGRWLFNTQKLKLTKFLEYSPIFDGFGGFSSVNSLLRILYQWVCVEVDMVGCQLAIGSALVAAARSHPYSRMTLVIDGHCRIFRAFPDSIASMATLASDSGWAWGDYTGQINDKHQSLELVFFGFQARRPQALDGEIVEEHSQPSLEIEVLQVLVRVPLTAARTSERSDPASELGVTVELTSSLSDNAPNSDLRSVPSSKRMEFFSSLDWQPIATLSASYSRVSPSLSKQN